jgi:hypothetical protein
VRSSWSGADKAAIQGLGYQWVAPGNCRNYVFSSSKSTGIERGRQARRGLLFRRPYPNETQPFA